MFRPHHLHEVAQLPFAAGGENGFRVILDALDEQTPVTDAHDFSVGGAAGDFQLRRQRRTVQRQRMIAHRVEGAGHAGEKALAVVFDRRNFTVHDRFGRDDFGAERLSDHYQKMYQSPDIH